MIKIKRACSMDDIKELKEMYIKSLSGPLESSIEEFIEYDSNTFLINHGDKTIGYFCVNKDKLLLQFYIVDDYISIGTGILQFLIKENYISTALASTRDRLLMSICLELQKKVNISCYLFGDWKKDSVSLPSFDSLNFRKADMNDRDIIRKVCGNFYDYLSSTLEDSIKSGDIYVLYSNQILLGTGSIVTKYCSPGYAEIGMYVNNSYRCKSLGTYIVTKLKENCYNNNLTPICNCDYTNTASRKALEKSGFISRDRLLKFFFID